MFSAKPMRVFLSALIFFAVALPASAQDRLTGATVRIIPSDVRRATAVGELVAADRYEIRYRPLDSGNVVTIARDDVYRFQYLDGKRRHYLEGAAAGLLAGTIAGLIKIKLDKDSSIDEATGKKTEFWKRDPIIGNEHYFDALLLAGIGTGVGAIAGWIIQTDRWVDVGFDTSRGAAPTTTVAFTWRFSGK